LISDSSSPPVKVGVRRCAVSAASGGAVAMRQAS
jgi:hypothetical protein